MVANEGQVTLVDGDLAEEVCSSAVDIGGVPWKLSVAKKLSAEGNVRARSVSTYLKSYCLGRMKK